MSKRNGSDTSGAGAGGGAPPPTLPMAGTQQHTEPTSPAQRRQSAPLPGISQTAQTLRARTASSTSTSIRSGQAGVDRSKMFEDGPGDDVDVGTPQFQQRPGSASKGTQPHQRLQHRQLMEYQQQLQQSQSPSAGASGPRLGASSLASSAGKSFRKAADKAAAKPTGSGYVYKGTPARSTRYSLPVRTEKPVRTSKTTGKHVVLPSESQLAPLPNEEDDDDEDDEDDDGSSEDDDEDGSESVEDDEDGDQSETRADRSAPTREEVEAQRKSQREVNQRLVEDRREAEAAERSARRPFDTVPGTANKTSTPPRLTSKPRSHPALHVPRQPSTSSLTRALGPAHARAPPRIPKTSGPAYHTFERLAPSLRTHTALPRLTSYALGTALHLPTLIGFLRREHGVRPRLYDECAYVVYFKPLLPGFGRANVRSAPEPRTGSPGGESRRERELEEREESGYVGGYFAPTGDEEEDIDREGYILGGEGEEAGKNPHSTTSGREDRDAASETDEGRANQYDRRNESEDDTETEGEGEWVQRESGSWYRERSRNVSASTDDSSAGRARDTDTGSESEDVQRISVAYVGDAESGLSDYRAEEPEATSSSLEEEKAHLLTTPRARPSSPDAITEMETAFELDQAEAPVVTSDTAFVQEPESLDFIDEPLSADKAGARDMQIQQLGIEPDDSRRSPDGARTPRNHRETTDPFDDIVAARGESAIQDSEERGLPSSSSGRDSRRRRSKKSKRSGNRGRPNTASHNHDGSPNMLTSRSILEAMQVAELIILPYGVLVMYNLSLAEERAILDDVISSGCVRGALKPQDEETEAFHFCYDPSVPAPRIFNDFFTFRNPNHLLKLSLAHAIAQSTKLSVFEESMQRTLELTSHIPKELASTGELRLKRREALRLTGSLFKLRVDVNLTSNVLDTPELFWSEASLKALYDAIREYLEIDSRVENLNERLAVANDLLEIIHEHIANEAMSKITWIIIVLIIVACIVACGEISARLVLHARDGPTRVAIRTALRASSASASSLRQIAPAVQDQRVLWTAATGI